MAGLNTTVYQKTVKLAPGVDGSVSVKGKIDAALGIGIAGLALSYDPQTGTTTISFSALGGIANVGVGQGSATVSVGAGAIVGAKVGIFGGYAKVEAIVQTKIGLVDLKVDTSLAAKGKLSVIAATLEGKVEKSFDCFPAGTLVTLASGDTIPIEEVTANEHVVSFSNNQSNLPSNDAHSTGDYLTSSSTKVGTVKQLFTNVADEFVELIFNDPITGEQKTLTSTLGHVYLDESGKWNKLSDMLAANDSNIFKLHTNISHSGKGRNTSANEENQTIGQKHGAYTGSVNIVIAEGQIVEAQAYTIKYSAATAGLFEETQMLVTRTEGSVACQPYYKKGWKTYNFEVAEHHNYIAGGIRVHNDSTLATELYGNNTNFTGVGLEHTKDIWNGNPTEDTTAYSNSGDVVHYDKSSDSVSVTNKYGVTTTTNRKTGNQTVTDWDSSDGVSNGGGSGTGKPIIIDLDGDGIEIAPQHLNYTLFDFDDDGFEERTAWVGADDGLLVFDENNDGEVTSAREIAFTQWMEEEGLTDLEALAEFFDTNNDGVLDITDVSLQAGDRLVDEGILTAGTAVWDSFKIWQDSNSNGDVDAGELKTLSEWGITSISLSYSNSEGVILNDGTAINGFMDVTMNGETVLGGDVALRYMSNGIREYQDADGNTLYEYETGESVGTRILDSSDTNFDLGDDTTVWTSAIGNAADNIITASSKTVETVLDGGAGNDVLTGGSNGDFLVGGDGIDSLFGGAGNDTLIIDGEDNLANVSGGIGYDTLVFEGAGALNIVLDDHAVEAAIGGDNDDVLDGTNDNLTYYSKAASFDTDGNPIAGDVEIGYYLDGGKGNDTLDGAAHNDQLIGGEGDDTLIAHDGNDVLDGGTGWDTLNGGAGNDVYVYRVGDNGDTISDGDGFDVIQFGYGIEFTDLAIEMVGNDLVINFRNEADDQIVIEGWNVNTNRIEALSFASGVVIPLANLNIGLTDSSAVAAGGNVIAYYFDLDSTPADLSAVDWNATPDFAEYLDETNINAGSGALWEDGQSDSVAVFIRAEITVETAGTYTFYTTSDDRSALVVDGSNVVTDNGNASLETRSGTVTLTVGTHIIEGFYLEDNGSSQFSMEWSGPGVTRKTIDASDQVAGRWIDADFLSGSITSGYENHHGGLGDDYMTTSEDYQRLYGGDGDDVLRADASNVYLAGEDGDDIMYAGQFQSSGLHSLAGHNGNDIYIIGQESNGIIRINENGSGIDFSGNDTIFFESLSLDDVSFYRYSNNFLGMDWEYNGIIGTVTILINSNNAETGIETLVFADGTSIETPKYNDLPTDGSYASLVYKGTANNDLIIGTSKDDTISGEAGDDQLDARGTEGGTQYLSGGEGNDTYFFSSISGNVVIDTAAETSTSGDDDRVVFTNLNRADVDVSITGSTLRFTAADPTGDQFQLDIADLGAEIEMFVFADGTHFDANTILDPYVPPSPPTSGENKVNDNANETEFLTGTTDNDTFVINGVSSDFGWGDTDDGTGTVVWNNNSGANDLLFGFENIEFTDTTIGLTGAEPPITPPPATSNEYIDNVSETEFLTGTTDNDTFVINGVSSDFGWGDTDDGMGTVVWNNGTGANDLLFGFENIEFTDTIIDISNNPTPPPPPSTTDNLFTDNPNQTEYLTGSSTELDTFVIAGNSTDFGWGDTDDGTGTVVWNNNSGANDLLFDFDNIQFDDTIVSIA